MALSYVRNVEDVKCKFFNGRWYGRDHIFLLEMGDEAPAVSTKFGATFGRHVLWSEGFELQLVAARYPFVFPFNRKVSCLVNIHPMGLYFATNCNVPIKL